jgi:hypothetical protein
MAWWGNLSPPTRLVLKLTAGLVLVGAALYVVTTIETTQADAFDIATGTSSPYSLNAGVAGVLLAIVGYLFAPAVAGTILAAVVDTAQRDRAPTMEQLKPEISAEISAEFERYLNSRKTPTTPAGPVSPPLDGKAQQAVTADRQQEL